MRNKKNQVPESLYEYGFNLAASRRNGLTLGLGLGLAGEGNNLHIAGSRDSFFFQQTVRLGYDALLEDAIEKRVRCEK